MRRPLGGFLALWRIYSCFPGRFIEGALETKTLNPHADVAFVFAFVIIILSTL